MVDHLLNVWTSRRGEAYVEPRDELRTWPVVIWTMWHTPAPLRRGVRAKAKPYSPRI
jgi:hypothetical protein